MYRIGEFSAKTGATVKTLRYYDEIGLLKPSFVDQFTNYRYYTNDQIKYFEKIEYLKKLSFTLDEIKANLPNIKVEAIEQKLIELQRECDFITSQIHELNNLINILKDKEKVLVRK